MAQEIFEYEGSQEQFEEQARLAEEAEDFYRERGYAEENFGFDDERLNEDLEMMREQSEEFELNERDGLMLEIGEAK